MGAFLPGVVFCCCLFVGWVLLCQGLCIGWLSGRYCFAMDYFSLPGTTLCLFVRDDSLSRDCFNTVSPSHTPLFLLFLLPICRPQVASVACRLLKEDASVCNPNHTGTSNFGSKIHSFCIGLEGSPDLAAAKTVADFLGTCGC